MLTKIELQAMDAVIGIRREMEKANEVNWEQRRYEIAKEVLPELVAISTERIAWGLDPTGYSELAQQAVGLADALIEELKQS